MTVLGLEEGKVALYPHDEAWETMAQGIIREIRAIMKEDCLAIEHVGGTSIRPAWAKPIIDIQVLVPDYAVIDSYIPRLRELGIEYLGEMVPELRLGIIRTPDHRICTHHIHFMTPDKEDWQAIINIRDFCNRDPLGGKVYSESKQLYAKGNEALRTGYRDAKGNLYVVLRQCGQIMHEGDLGLITGSDFLDAFFHTALGKLEDPAFIDETGRTVLNYAAVCGRLARGAVKLKDASVPLHQPILVQMRDLSDRITACLSVLCYGGIIVLIRAEASEEEKAEISRKIGAAYTADDAFFEDIMCHRDHHIKVRHEANEPALFEQKEDGSFHVISYNALSDEILRKAGVMESGDHPEETCGSCIPCTQQMITILADLTAGRAVKTQAVSAYEPVL